MRKPIFSQEPVFSLKTENHMMIVKRKSGFMQRLHWSVKAHFAKALKIYKKFTKRRTDVVIDFEGAQVLIGPEAIYRLAFH